MNKCAKCIEMLNILKNRNTYISKAELAQRLEINPRNIKEYRKELEEAGYELEYKPGKYGGYRLNQNCIIPSLRLTLSEEKALRMGARFIEEHKEVTHLEEFRKAIEKINGAMITHEGIDYAYRNSRIPKYTSRIAEMVAIAESAIEGCNEIVIEYESKKAMEYQMIHVFPYDLIFSNGFYYIIGYALHRKAFRTYKISEQRMRSIVILNRVFQRDLDYRLENYIGNKSIYKGEEQRVEIAIHGGMATYIAENEVGIASSSYFEGDTLYLTTTFENEAACDSFILSLGESAEVLGSNEVKQRIKNKIERMYKKYNENEKKN